MLKIYHRHTESGASAAYWEEFGSGTTLADHLRFCDVDPLRPLFLRFLKPGVVMLEGGCGRGQYVAYYGARGANVIGLDFAREWLKAARAEIPWLRLCAGDVASLPFRDRSFDVYYSGGVVEHFEAGADRALAEARRVLKRDGVLLLSVPYFSPLRRVLSFVGRDTWRRVAGPSMDERADRDWRFYQYAYTVREFTTVLSAAGFSVLETQGYAILWGLYDIDPLRRAGEFIGRRAEGPANAGHHRGQEAAPAERAPVVSGFSRADERNLAPRASFFKRLLVAEDSTVPAVGWLVKAGRWACANMMMYVCTPSPTPQAA